MWSRKSSVFNNFNFLPPLGELSSIIKYYQFLSLTIIFTHLRQQQLSTCIHLDKTVSEKWAFRFDVFKLFLQHVAIQLLLCYCWYRAQNHQHNYERECGKNHEKKFNFSASQLPTFFWISIPISSSVCDPRPPPPLSLLLSMPRSHVEIVAFQLPNRDIHDT